MLISLFGTTTATAAAATTSDHSTTFYMNITIEGNT
jgi:hypothetical protein